MTLKFEESYVVFDLEATIRCPVGSLQANPHWPSNFVVCAAFTVGSGVNHSYNNVAGTPVTQMVVDAINHRRIVVGHNLLFDLQWLKRDTANTLDLSEKTLWDTALAEYVLSGQESKFPSLNEVATKYGLPIKDDKVAKLWEAGVDTNLIPSSLLIPYCEQDVANTEKIFLKQLAEAKKLGVLKLILVLNDALLAIVEMMYNGMKVDAKSLTSFTAAYQKILDKTEIDFKECVTKRTKYSGINLASPKQLSALLYGGTLKHKVKELDGAYKTGLKAGLPKYKTIVHEIKFPGICTIPKSLGIEEGIHGYSTNDESLVKLSRYTKDPYISYIQQHRDIDKQLNTYFNKTKELLFPKDFIYHNINPTATSTGRYSSSEPNLQNITRGEKSDIKKCYVSRFEDGYIVEIDFRQLEVVALAHLSRCSALIADIEYGVDIHSTLYISVYGRIPTKDQRTEFKRATFALLYGAGPKKISKLTGMSMFEAKELIRAWHRRYPETTTYWERVQKEVTDLREPSERRDGISGKPLGKAKWITETGRILTFLEYIPEWTDKAGFSPNDTKNHPVQSFATGDLVPLFLGKLARGLLASAIRHKALLVNTVHDSVVLDVANGYVDECVKVLRNVSANMERHIKTEFGIEMQCPLEVSISHGPNWSDQLEIKSS